MLCQALGNVSSRLCARHDGICRSRCTRPYVCEEAVEIIAFACVYTRGDDTVTSFGLGSEGSTRGWDEIR